MIKETSGKIYRFKLDHDLGYGFAEIYDFTDNSMFDGRIAYVYNRHDKAEKPMYIESEIRSTGIALGPIRLYKFPNTRGLHAWKFLFKTDHLLIDTIPETKELRGLIINDNNWDNLRHWHSSRKEYEKGLSDMVPYEKIRHLETRIVNSPSSIVTKFTMKVLLDSNKMVSDYYDLNNLGDKNMFVQLINTYYSLVKAKEFLDQLPRLDNKQEIFAK